MAATGLVVTGLVSSWELAKSVAGGAGTNPTNGTAIGPPPSQGSQNQTLSARKTVTVTETVGGPSQGNSTSSQTSQVSSSTSAQVPAGYALVAPLSALAGKTSAYFNHPTAGLALLLSLAGQWKAFTATCTHAPCTVQFTGSSIQCPCHGGIYSPSNGAVQGGPPPAPLRQFGVLVQNGNLYVTT